MNKLCGAKTRSGGTCKNRAMPNGRCRMHGGKSLGGIASPTYKHGRYSKYLPERLRERYVESLSDPDLIALREEISLTDARIEDLIKRVDSGESGEAWALARKALGELLEAETKGESLHGPIAMLGEIIQRGLDDYGAWRELGGMIEMRRRLVESERKRLVDMQMMISAERAMLLISSIADIIRRNVTDVETKRAIQVELTAILTRGENQESLPAERK